jgi:hypothetical protein
MIQHIWCVLKILAPICGSVLIIYGMGYQRTVHLNSASEKMMCYFNLYQSSMHLNNNFDKDFKISTHNSVLLIYFPMDDF